MTADALAMLLQSAVPADRFRADNNTLGRFARDTTECEAGQPDIVIFLNTAEEAHAVVKIAADHRIPLIPRIAGTNLGGLSIPLRGGAILDLTSMNRSCPSVSCDSTSYPS